MAAATRDGASGSQFIIAKISIFSIFQL